jgi:hypothetical protein
MADQRLKYVIEFDNKGAIQSMQQVEAGQKRVGQSGEAAGHQASNGIDKMTASMTKSVFQANLLYAGFMRVAEATKRLFMETTMAAAQNEKMEVITRRMAQTHGLNAESVMRQVEAIKRLGYLDEEALSVVSKMIGANMDLSRATEIATKARDAGAFADVKAGEALETMLFAAESGYGKTLRSMNIFVNLTKAVADEQKHLGYEMTDEEKRLFNLKLILDETAKLHGTWEAKMETSAGQMEGLGKQVTKTKEAIGKEFQADLKTVVDLFKSMVEWGAKNPDVLAKIIKYVVEFSAVLTAAAIANKLMGIVTALRALSVATMLNPFGLIVGGLAAAGFAMYNFSQDREKYWEGQNQAARSTDILRQIQHGGIAAARKAGYSETEIAGAYSRRAPEEAGAFATEFGITVKGFEKPGTPTVDHKRLGKDEELEAIKQAEKRAAEILDEARKGTKEGLSKVIQEYWQFAGEIGSKSKAAMQNIAAAFRLAIQGEAKKELHKNAEETQKKWIAEGEETRQRQIEFGAGTGKIMGETDKKQDQDQLTAAQTERDQRLRNLEMVHADTVAEQVKLSRDKLAVELDFINEEARLHREEIDERKDRDLEYLYWLATIYPNEAAEIERRIEAVMVSAAEDLKQIGDKASAEAAANTDQASIRIAEVARNRVQGQFDSLKKSAGDVFDSLLHKSQNVFEAIGNIFKTTILSAIKEVVSSRIAAMLMSMFYGVKVGFANNGGMVPNSPVFGGGGGGAAAGAGGILASLGGIFRGGGGGGSIATPPFVPGAGAGSIYGPSLEQLGGGVGANVGGFGGGGGAAGGSAGGGILGMLKALAGPGGKNAAMMGGGLMMLQGAQSGNALSTIGGGAALGYGMSSMLGMTGVGGAIAGAGLGLAINGTERGGALGIAEATGGGALVGMQFGGPLGAAIGAGIGFLASLGRTLFGGKNDVDETRDRIKKIYGVDIADKGVLNQIVKMAKSGFGGSIDTAIRSPEVRKLIEEYAMATGQKYTGPSASPQSATLAQSGGSLYQAPTYQGGTPLPSLGGSLPTLGGVTSTSAGAVTIGNLSLSVNGQSAADALEGRVASVVTPSYVASASMQAQAANNGRLATAAMQLQPSTLLR